MEETIIRSSAITINAKAVLLALISSLAEGEGVLITSEEIIARDFHFDRYATHLGFVELLGLGIIEKKIIRDSGFKFEYRVFFEKIC